MARLRRKNLTSEHETRFPLVDISGVGMSAEWLRSRLSTVTLTLCSDDHRYLVELTPEDCTRVRRWLIAQALGIHADCGATSEPERLRELADMLEREEQRLADADMGGRP